MNVNEILRSQNQKGIYIRSDYNLCHFKKHSETSIEYRRAGNKFYGKKELDDYTCIIILSLYSGSIALAPDNSEELAFGFGNRSALLKHMKKFQECISDIDRALSITKSDNLKAKLLARKRECSKLIKESLKDVQNSKKVELPKIIPSKKVSCVAESVSLKYNKNYGKHLVANKDIKPGEIVAIEEAYIAYPQTKKRHIVCSHCLSKTYNGIPCTFCAFIYCSDICKDQAWQEYHDIECSIIHKVSIAKLPSIPGFMECKDKFYHIARFFIKVIKTWNVEKIVQEVKKSDTDTISNTFFCNQFQSCYSLMSHTSAGNSQNTISLFDEFSSEIVALLLQFESIFTNKVISCFKSQDELFAFTKKLLIKFFHTESLNAYSFQESYCSCPDSSVNSCDGTCTSRGDIIALCCSLFNHSCFPNTARIYAEKKKIVIVSTQPIKKGEQLFVNYNGQICSIKNPKADRQAYLEKNYFFKCSCPPCSDNWPPLDVSKKPDPRVMKLIIADYEKFCNEKGMKPILSGMNLSTVLSDNKISLKHVSHIAELLHEYSSRTDLRNYLFDFSVMIRRIFTSLYGIDKK